MNDLSPPEAQGTLGSLLRCPYEKMSEWLYAELARQGYPDVRSAFSAVFRNLPPGGARVVELAERAGMTKQSMGYLVDQMEAAGYVCVEPDPRDRRAKTVRLTARGEELVALALRLSARYEAYLAELVGERRMKELRAVLTLLQQQLKEVDGPPPA